MPSLIEISDNRTWENSELALRAAYEGFGNTGRGLLHLLDLPGIVGIGLTALPLAPSIALSSKKVNLPEALAGVLSLSANTKFRRLAGLAAIAGVIAHEFLSRTYSGEQILSYTVPMGLAIMATLTAINVWQERKPSKKWPEQKSSGFMFE